MKDEGAEEKKNQVESGDQKQEETKKSEEAPQKMEDDQIDSGSKPNENPEEPKDEEPYNFEKAILRLSKEVFEYFALAEHLIDIFCEGKLECKIQTKDGDEVDFKDDLKPEDKKRRSQILSKLQIDLHFKRADFLRYYGDDEAATKDYLTVIELCGKYRDPKYKQNW